MSDITLQSYKYCHHCVQHHIAKLQILSSLCPTSHYKVTNTVIIVSDITLQSYKYCHHCVRHHITKLQILSSLCPTSHYKVTNTSENQPHGSHYVDILIYFEVG
jgi:hypothetical protein